MAMTTRPRRKGARARTGVLAIAAVSVLLLGEPPAAMAGEPTDQVRAHITVMYGAVGASASAPSPSGMGSVRKVADQMFDWRAMAREALGDDWAKRSAEEQNEAVVRTRVVTRNGSAIPVNYLTRRDETGRWRVYDLDVERINLVRNYRSQFASIIRRTSFEQLLARLKAVEDKRNSVEG